MPAVVRKTSTKVVGGRVTRKSRSDLSEVHGYVIEKVAAGKGFTHVVSARQLERFIELIPNWSALSSRLERIVLDHGQPNYFGYHQFHHREKTATIALCAWPKELWTPLSPRFFSEHREIFETLGVSYQINLTRVTCHFSVAQARAFSLLNVFLHEVGHHHDSLRRRGVGLPGKERIAEEFARGLFETMLPLYQAQFGDPAKREMGGEED